MVPSQWQHRGGLDVTEFCSWHLFVGRETNVLWLQKWGGSSTPTEDSSQHDLLSLLMSPCSMLVGHLAGREYFLQDIPHSHPHPVVHSILYHNLPFWMPFLQSLQHNVSLFNSEKM